MKSVLYYFLPFLPILAFAVEPVTEKNIDLNRYLGTWYEIAKFENEFQKDCAQTKAVYSLWNKNIRVENSCKSIHNPEQLNQALGLAWVVDRETSAKLKVSFVPFLRHLGIGAGDYWILYVDKDYSVAVVGTPNREYLWFLSRTPEISSEIYQKLVDIADQNDFDITKIIKTPKWTNQ